MRRADRILVFSLFYRFPILGKIMILGIGGLVLLGLILGTFSK